MTGERSARNAGPSRGFIAAGFGTILCVAAVLGVPGLDESIVYLGGIVMIAAGVLTGVLEDLLAELRMRRADDGRRRVRIENR